MYIYIYKCTVALYPRPYGLSTRFVHDDTETVLYDLEDYMDEKKKFRKFIKKE